jgi:hypothetical protein
MSEATATDPVQIVRALLLLAGFILGLFFGRYGRAAIGGVILGALITALLVWGLMSTDRAPASPSYAIGYIGGTAVFCSVLGALLGCLIHRGVARLFRRRDKAAPP